MAAGLPCVVTSVGGIPSLVSDQINGLLVSARDVAGLTAALERVLTDNQLARALGDGAREVVSSRFSPTAVAARYAELYRELAGSHVRWAGRSPDGRR
jgi:glycosyltransferase involved in cell wall biosynthesis